MASDISEFGSALKKLTTSFGPLPGQAEGELSVVVVGYSETVGEAIEGFSNLQDVVDYSTQAVKLVDDVTTGNYWSLTTDIASDTAQDVAGILGGIGGAAAGALSGNPAVEKASELAGANAAESTVEKIIEYGQSQGTAISDWLTEHFPPANGSSSETTEFQ